MMEMIYCKQHRIESINKNAIKLKYADNQNVNWIFIYKYKL
jgi:hypothetical protein